MSFPFYPKHEYACPHVNHCPHLGGAALGSVVFAAAENLQWTDSLLRQIDTLREQNAAQARVIAEQQERIEQLERELKAERQKQFKATRPDEEIPTETNEPQTEAKKRGAPVGHPGWFRATPTKTDRTIDVPAPVRCPHCGAAVKPRPELECYEHVQEDLIDGRPTVTCYRHVQGRCRNPKCRLWVRQPGEGEILGAKIGPQMRARGMFLRFGIGLPYRKVVSAIEGLDSLGFTPAALLGFEKRRRKGPGRWPTTWPRSYGRARSIMPTRPTTPSTASPQGLVPRQRALGALLHLRHAQRQDFPQDPGRGLCGRFSHGLLRGLRPSCDEDQAAMLAAFETHGEGLAKSDAGKSRRGAAVLPRRGGMGQARLSLVSTLEVGLRPGKEREAAWLRSEQARLESVVLDAKRRRHYKAASAAIPRNGSRSWTIRACRPRTISPSRRSASW